jgi:hypothetical protein
MEGGTRENEGGKPAEAEEKSSESAAAEKASEAREKPAAEEKPAAREKPAVQKKPGADEARRRKMLRGWLIALVLVVALVAWVATRGGDDSSSDTVAPQTAPPEIVTAGELAAAAADVGYPIYWAGTVPGTSIELTELAEGARVRYVPEGTEAGEGSAGVLTISSYPLPDPQAALDGYAERPGATVREGEDGRQVVVNLESPTSAYFASPDNTVQVEVYDPSPQRALDLALSADVEPAS